MRKRICRDLVREGEVCKGDGDIMTISRQLEKMRYIPYGTDDYEKEVKKLEGLYERRSSKYKEEYVLCTDGLLSESRSEIIEELRCTNTKFPVNRLEDLTIFPNEDFRLVKRSAAEFNLNWLQMVVNVLITDKKRERFIMMEVNRGRLQMVGGHVSFSNAMYTRNLAEVLSQNIRREIYEELGDLKQVRENVIYKIPRLPEDILVPGTGGSRRFFDLFHAFALYTVEVDNLDKLYKTIKENGTQSKKERVVIVGKTDLVSRTNRWLLNYINV